MATKLNWRKIVSLGSGALVATLSTAYAFSPTSGEGTVGHSVKLEPKSGSNLRVTEVFAQHVAPQENKEQILKDAIRKSTFICERIKDEKGLPGLTIGVSVNGKLVWQEGFGYADLENNVHMKPEGVMRIASISKSITMAMLAKLMEEGKIDIDKPIQTYLPTFPEKYVNGEKVTITTRHLLSHLSGIRHYTKKENEKEGEKDETTTKENKSKPSEKENSKNKKRQKRSEEELKIPQEFLLKEKFDSVEEAMKLFQEDELFFKPGTNHHYTTHGWTVVSALIEKLTGTEFPTLSKRMFDFWGLNNTTLDLHEPLIYNRVRYYNRHKNGQIINAPYVDNSYKWAGGGFISNVADLTQFANILIYSMQTAEDDLKKLCDKGLPKEPYLKQSTMKAIWTGNPVAFRPHSPDSLYAMGFVVSEPMRKCMFCKEKELMSVQHDGGAMGASSMLYLTFPTNCNKSQYDSKSKTPSSDGKEPDVKGVVVAMITNITGAGMAKAAEEIAHNFKKLI